MEFFVYSVRSVAWRLGYLVNEVTRVVTDILTINSKRSILTITIVNAPYS